MRLVITRPEEDAVLLKARLESMGHVTMLAPLLKIVPRAAVPVPQKEFQLICATSANALKCFNATDELRKIPVLVVGPQSLAQARQAGFTSSEAHGGDVHGLASHIIKTRNPDRGPVLYLAGAETSADLQALLVKENFAVEKLIVYDAVIQRPADIAQTLVAAEGVLLYSPRSARIWVDLVRDAGLETSGAVPTYYCLSENVAKMLPHQWRARIAEKPDEAAMLALLD